MSTYKSRIILLFVLLFGFQASYAESGVLTVYNHLNNLEVNIKTQLLCETNFRAIVGSSSRWEGDLDENPIKYDVPTIASWKNCSIADKQFVDDFNAYFSFRRNHKQWEAHNLVTVELVDLTNKRNRLSFSIPVERTGSSPLSKEVNFFGNSVRVSIEHHGNYAGKNIGHYDDFAYFGPVLTQSSTTIVIDKPEE